MDVNVHFLEEVRWNLKGLLLGFKVGKGCLRRLLHNFANLSGHLHVAFSFDNQHFDRHDFSAVLRPGDGRSHTDFVILLRHCREELRWSEQLGDMVCADFR